MTDPVLFRTAVERGDIDLVRESFRDDVHLHSPVLFRGFQGRDAAVTVIATVKELLSDFVYVHEARAGDAVFLHFKAKTGDLEIEGIDLLELDDEGLVRELTVFMRPMRAVQQFA